MVIELITLADIIKGYKIRHTLTTSKDGLKTINISENQIKQFQTWCLEIMWGK
ncbi:hypothetical protein MEO93_27060 [Dolichospermum sp. ST_sed3]|nr:hypothetical protein [Dolichospermum sp. ST_sed3]